VYADDVERSTLEVEQHPYLTDSLMEVLPFKELETDVAQENPDGLLRTLLIPVGYLPESYRVNHPTRTDVIGVRLFGQLISVSLIKEFF
jgi:hypothetical protein